MGARLLIAALTMTMTTVAAPTAATAANPLEVVFLAVGQGDAVLFRGPCGETGLIDARQGAADEVLGQLDAWGSRSLAWISVSHYDADHLGDLVDVGTASGVTVGAVYDRGGSRSVKDTDTYRSYYDWVTGAGLRHPVDIGDRFTLCTGAEAVTFDVVSAGTDGTAVDGVAVSEENDRGVCIHLQYGSFDLASCGDVNGTGEGSRTDVETAVADSYGDVEVAKVNHHGSKYSSNATYVDTLRAQVAVLTVGKNSYGHPDPDVVSRWDATGDVFQTQRADTGAAMHGTITVSAAAFGPFSVRTTSGISRNYSLDESTTSNSGSGGTDPWDGNLSTVERLGSNDRVATGISVSITRFGDDQARHVVLSRDDKFPDALAGSVLTGQGPMLLTAPGRLYASVRSEIDRVLPDAATVYLLGGEKALAPAIADELDDRYDVRRLSGPDRFATAAAIASEGRRLYPDSLDVLIARAFGPASDPEGSAAWADSVAAGAYAARFKTVILLSASESLSPAADRWLKSHQTNARVLLGGTAALSDQVAKQASATHRIAGAERSATAVEFAKQRWGHTSPPTRQVVIDGRTSAGWSFGLQAAGLAADHSVPVLLIEPTSLPAPTATYLSTCDTKKLDTLVVGGDNHVSPSVASEIESRDGRDCSPTPPPPDDDGGSSEECDPAYPDFCIPPPPPDKDCSDFSQNNFTVDRRYGDPHRLDGDADGVACES